jgi:phytoene/squalene synthetase
VERARAMMLSGAPLACRLPGRVGWELRLVVQGGLRILERIEAADYDMFRHRPQLRLADWLCMIGRALRMKIRLSHPTQLR